MIFSDSVTWQSIVTDEPLSQFGRVPTKLVLYSVVWHFFPNKLTHFQERKDDEMGWPNAKLNRRYLIFNLVPP